MEPEHTKEQSYFDSLSEKEKKAYEVAKNHLGSLWNVFKCNGYLQWEKKQKLLQKPTDKT